MIRTYVAAGPTLEAFHNSDAFVRFIRGPIGSGKSTGCCAEILKRAHEQKPSPDGRRRTRWAAIRNTYGELKTTTVRTWHQWLPEHIGKFSLEPPPTHRLVTGELDFEIHFLALDRAEDVKKLLSLELTGAWINEAREVPKAILDALTGRVGRFPAMADGGATWAGIILDGMSPDGDHWWYRLAEEERPEGYEFFSQPGAVVRADDAWTLNPNAENLHNLPADYYAKALVGKSDDWIKVYLANEYGYFADGRPVYPEWRDSTHVSPDALAPIEGLPVYVGLDFGLTPAAIFGQRTARGQWRIVDEMVADDMGVVRFSELLSARLEEWYPNFEIEAWGDPAGNTRAETDEKTCFGLLREHAGLRVRAAPSNDFTLRREAVAATLNRMVDGEPGLLLSPHCKVLRKGFAGGYAFRRVHVAGDERYQDKADKNAFSHPHDALQYLLLGGGEGRAILGREARRRGAVPVRAESSYDVLRH